VLDYFISTFTIWGAGSNCLFMYYHLFLHALLNLRILTLSISILDQSSSTLVFFFSKCPLIFHRGRFELENFIEMSNLWTKPLFSEFVFLLCRVQKLWVQWPLIGDFGLNPTSIFVH